MYLLTYAPSEDTDQAMRTRKFAQSHYENTPIQI